MSAGFLAGFWQKKTQSYQILGRSRLSNIQALCAARLGQRFGQFGRLVTLVMFWAVWVTFWGLVRGVHPVPRLYWRLRQGSVTDVRHEHFLSFWGICRFASVASRVQTKHFEGTQTRSDPQNGDEKKKEQLTRISTQHDAQSRAPLREKTSKKHRAPPKTLKPKSQAPKPKKL